jgi:hypothetical protein
MMLRGVYEGCALSDVMFPIHNFMNAYMPVLLPLTPGKIRLIFLNASRQGYERMRVSQFVKSLSTLSISTSPTLLSLILSSCLSNQTEVVPQEEVDPTQGSLVNEEVVLQGARDAVVV